jgi:predicted nucleic acid-binding protein
MSPRPRPPRPTRAFLDACVLYSASRGGRLVDLWSMPNVELVTSEYAIKEAWDNLEKERDARACRDRLSDLASSMDVIPYDEAKHADQDRPWTLPDPDDIPILRGALDSECEYLISVDNAGFGHLYGQRCGGVKIVRPRAFIEDMRDRTLPTSTTDRPTTESETGAPDPERT